MKTVENNDVLSRQKSVDTANLDETAMQTVKWSDLVKRSQDRQKFKDDRSLKKNEKVAVVVSC